ncbi:MAG: tagaturonate reductase [Chitinophagaceae bacterium]|jgi:tagaturonate reductase|nr:tagaturonate reductase [Chitinophagaceae bacterium]
MIKLSKANLSGIEGIATPCEKIFELPEKVLQFGTGVLLRGLPDYFIDKANKENIFNGRVAVVKSTMQNSIDEFATQDGLYTICIRGWKNNAAQSADYLNASISRVINANADWAGVLACAENPELKIIISNTTELGIVLDENDKITTSLAPASFPAKLLAFLYRRFQYFKGDKNAGMVVIPTELIPDNGAVLKEICIKLANIHSLENEFIQWLENANEFCDSLVDRIVPGKVNAPEAGEIFQSLGYEDDLMIMSESYALWAIQTKNPLAIKEILSFHQIDEGVIITENIEKYRILKLHLLNASHTFSCMIALCTGFSYVNEAMNDIGFQHYIQALTDESTHAITSEQITLEEAKIFAANVLDRFRNPFIKHKWSDIARQTTLKIRMRCVPLFEMYYSKFNSAPTFMIKGFAAYLLFMKTRKIEGKFFASIRQKDFLVEDKYAEKLHEHWQVRNTEAAVKAIISDKDLWGTDLSLLNNFETELIKAINVMTVLFNGFPSF